MAKEPLQGPLRFPQVTENQLEIWLASPVTKAYLRCLEWKHADTIDNAGSGKLTDSSNADMTHAMLHRALGQQDAFVECGKVEKLLDFYVLIFHPPPPDEEEEAADGS